MKSHARASSAGSSSAAGVLASPRAFGALLCALGVLLLAPTFASAAVTHPFLEVFGSAAQPTVSSEETDGLAVDQSTGDVLVIEGGAGKLSRYHEDGTASDFSALGTNAIAIAFGFNPAEVQVAVDNSGSATDGNIYVAWGESSTGIKMFDEDGNSLGELTESSEGPLGVCAGVTVDPDGNVYVSCGGEKIHKYDPSGAAPAKADNVLNFAFASAAGLAAGAGPTAGYLFATHFFGTTAKLDATTGAEKYDVDPGFFDTTLSVNPSNGRLLIAGEEKLREYNASGATPSAFSNTSMPVGSFTRGVAANGSTGNIYVTRTETTKIDVFAPVPLLALTINTAGGTGTGTVNCEVNGLIDAPCAAEYPDGSELKLIPAPGAQSEFAGYSGATGSIACTGTATCEFELKAASSVNAPFDLRKLTVVKNGTGTGTVTGGSPAEPNTINCGTGAGCEHAYLQGAIVTLKGASDAGTQAVAWSGCDAIIGANECEVAMTGVKNVTATFNLETRLLTVTKNGTSTGTVASVPAGTINCGTGVGCEHAYPLGEIVKLKGTPGANAQPVVWSGCDAIVGTNECEVTMTAVKNVTATFNLLKRKLTVSKSGTGSGSVTSSPAGINCGTGSGCEAEFDHNTVVTLTAVAGEKTKAVAWEGCASEPGPTECKVTMSAAKEVKAKFNLVTHTLTVNKAGTGSGSVTCNGGACAASYEEGTSVTLAAGAGGGSTFAGWSGGGCSGTGSCVVTVNADTAVTATFNANPSSPPPPPPPPAEDKCVVPKLAKKSLGQAKSALKAAKCALGKVTKPKKAKGALVVKSSKPAAGTSLPAGSKVGLKLGPKPKKKS